MVESRHIECIINIDEINSFQTNVPFFTFLKTENCWLSNVSWGYRNITFSLNEIKVYIEIVCSVFRTSKRLQLITIQQVVRLLLCIVLSRIQLYVQRFHLGLS